MTRCTVPISELAGSLRADLTLRSGRNNAAPAVRNSRCRPCLSPVAVLPTARLPPCRKNYSLLASCHRLSPKLHPELTRAVARQTFRRLGHPQLSIYLVARSASRRSASCAGYGFAVVTTATPHQKAPALLGLQHDRLFTPEPRLLVIWRTSHLRSCVKQSRVPASSHLDSSTNPQHRPRQPIGRSRHWGTSVHRQPPAYYRLSP